MIFFVIFILSLCIGIPAVFYAITGCKTVLSKFLFVVILAEAIGIGILFITLYIVTPEWHLSNELQYFYELDQKYDFSTEEY